MIDSLNYLQHEGPHTTALLAKRSAEGGSRIAFIILIPVLVILSGIFAGLTLGYMSLDETQLNVLSTSGTEKQKKYAAQIIPIRKNGHLLLITLILANMITNETLPVVSDQVLPGSVFGVIISTALIVVFAEIIPQTVCTRYGLVIGAKMALAVRCLIILFWPIAWPIAKFLEVILGPHHGIIYRRSELKELIAMHADDHPQGHGELKHDTAAIIGHTLDLQEKVVSDAMTPVDKVFMLSIDSVLDYATLTKIHKTGHSRIPVYEEVEITHSVKGHGNKIEKLKKIVGVLLVKQCVLLDPEDATPLRSIPLNKVLTISYDEPLLKVLDRFQEGRSHIAIVTRISSGRAASVKEVVKPALTKRFLNRFRDSDSSSDEEDLEKGNKKSPSPGLGSKRSPVKPLEQTMPADALLPKANVEKLLQGFDPYTSPLGIITLEDVLEELIGEEIYDEFDLHGAQALPASTYLPPEAQAAVSAPAGMVPAATTNSVSSPPTAKSKPAVLKMPLAKMAVPSFGGFGLIRTRSAPGTPRGTGIPSNEATIAKVESNALDHIRETQTPSPEAVESAEKLDEKNETVERRSTFDSPPVYGPVPEISIEPARSSSTPPSPSLNRNISLMSSAPITPAPTPAFGRTPIPPSPLTEAVLRGRQSRVSSARVSTAIPNSGAVTPVDSGVAMPNTGISTVPRAVVKGRFKSRRIEDGPPSPTLSNARAKKQVESGNPSEELL